MKKWLLPVIMVLSILLSGCSDRLFVQKKLEAVTAPATEPQKIGEPVILFAEKELENLGDLDQLQIVKPEELKNYPSEFRKYNTYTYYAHLNNTEKLLYHAYEYAMEKALPYIWVDERLLLGKERSEFQVLEFYALDSALVEQNIDFYQKVDTAPTGEFYTYISVGNFTKAKLKNKKQSILEALRMLARMSDWKSAPDRELAEHIYDTLGDFVLYTETVESGEYLYNGLYEGKTNCDGFTNAFSLMCAIGGIPCVEINSDTPLGEIGHTWNAVYLEGKWVHVDSTGAEADVTSESQHRRKERVNFGFPDDLLTNRILYPDIVPACPVGLSPVLKIDSPRDPDFFSKVKREYIRNNRSYATILLKQGELDNQTLDELVTKLECSLYYLRYKTAEGKSVYYLFGMDE